MKQFVLPLCMVLVLTCHHLVAQDFECQDPPYYTLYETLYGNSPSSQMQFAHELIGIFSRTDGSSEDESDHGERVGIRQEFIAGIKTVIVEPRNLRNDKIILYFHGGGYSEELILFQWDMAVDIAKKTGSPVYLVDYGLVPQFTFPAPVEQGLAVYLELLGSFSADQIVFMGDSAGGGLALGLAGKLRDDQVELPAQLVLISPWLDVEGDNPDMPAIDPLDKMLSLEGLQNGGLNYVNGDEAELDNPYASPLLLEGLGELPPTILFIGTHEILFPDAVLFRDKAMQQGMDLTYVEVEGGFHVWLGAPAWLVPESAWSRRQVASFINCHPESGREAVVSAVDFNEKNWQVKVYPNPVNAASVIEVAAGSHLRELSGGFSISMVDVHGRVVFRKQLEVHSPIVALDDLSLDIAAGVYYLRVRSADTGKLEIFPIVVSH